MKAASWNSPEKHNVSGKTYNINLNPGLNRVVLRYPVGEKMQLWSEFSPSLYKLTAELITKEGTDNLQADFGFRKFSTSGTQFTINGINHIFTGRTQCMCFSVNGIPANGCGELA